MARTRVVQYTWTGRMELAVEQSGIDGDNEALDEFNTLLREESPLRFMNRYDEEELIVDADDGQVDDIMHRPHEEGG